MSAIHFSKLAIRKLADYLTQLPTSIANDCNNAAYLDTEAFKQQWQQLQ